MKKTFGHLHDLFEKVIYIYVAYIRIHTLIYIALFRSLGAPLGMLLALYRLEDAGESRHLDHHRGQQGGPEREAGGAKSIA